MIEFILYFSNTVVLSSLFMVASWVGYSITRQKALIIFSWPIGIMLCCFIYLKQININLGNILISILLLVWAIRLSLYIFFTRIWVNKQDVRYKVFDNLFCSIEPINSFIHYQIQAIIFSLIASPLYLAFKASNNHSIIFYFGIITVIIGIIGEFVSDLQLYLFKKMHPKALYNQGLWKYSRHPNYFFELIIWLGFSISGIQSTIHTLVFIIPIILFSLMHFITIPLTEKYMLAKYQNFREYKKVTNELIPGCKTINIRTIRAFVGKMVRATILNMYKYSKSIWK